MCEPEYNPDDPLFLFSRSLDEAPQDQERSAASRLHEVLDMSPSPRAEAEELRALYRLIARWARQPVELDWDNHAALIQARIEHGTDADRLEQIDRLIERWGRETAPLHGDVFTEDVMARLAPKRGRITWPGRVLRLGVPLAAAAAVALVVFGMMWFTPAPEPFVRVVYEPWSSGSAGSIKPEDGHRDSGRTSRVVVSYARTLDDEEMAMRAPSEVSLGAVGSGSPGTWTEELPPI